MKQTGDLVSVSHLEFKGPVRHIYCPIGLTFVALKPRLMLGGGFHGFTLDIRRSGTLQRYND